MANPASLTGQYLTGARDGSGSGGAAQGQRPVHRHPRRAGQNNLQNVDVDIPARHLHLRHRGFGRRQIDPDPRNPLQVDRTPAQRRARPARSPTTKSPACRPSTRSSTSTSRRSARTPRSNPATYTGAFTPIREWFAALPEAQVRGYKPGRFSFNVKGGRCEACQGDGVIKIEMHFLPDVYVECDVCKGKRYKPRNPRHPLQGQVDRRRPQTSPSMRAWSFSRRCPRSATSWRFCSASGLGYVSLGQQATTLSGGEAQRVKLSKELARRATGRTLYILDEPTTGLHFEDVRKLLEVLQELRRHRQHPVGDRAQSRGDQDRRLDHRHRPRRR